VIYTKSILFENNIKIKDQLRNNDNKILKKKHSSPHVNNNKNYNNKNNYNNKTSNNYFNNNNKNLNNNQKKKKKKKKKKNKKKKKKKKKKKNDGLQKEPNTTKNLKTTYNYNFPTLDSFNESNLPSTFLSFKYYIPIKFLNNFRIKNSKIQKFKN